ncbi:MAG: hypothetical protein LBD81_00540 [Holosporaceae bacterium]|jgi:hypothetical protein|nr:hypothetical protein [Holosporaceae bacterium]
MALVNLQYNDVYYNSVAQAFTTLMGQRGSYLLPMFMKYPVMGNMEEVKSIDADGARWREAPAEPVVHSKLTHGKRFLKPNGFYISVLLDELESARTLYDPAQIASLLWDKIGIFIDQVILYGKDGTNGFAGNSLAIINKEDAIGHIVPLPDSQFVFFDNTNYGVSNEIADPDNILKYGLSAAKLMKGMNILRKNFASPNIICIANDDALTSLRADPRYANLQWNIQPAMASGVNTPYTGITQFFGSEQVSRNVPSKKDPTVLVDHAYLVDIEKVYIGYNVMKPNEIDMRFDPIPERHHALQIKVDCMYDCVRLQEEAVVCIEVKHQD